MQKRMKKRDREAHYRRIYQPYCIKRLANGRYITLNREHKPLGVETSELVRYEDFPHEHLPALTPAVAAQLSCRGSDDVDAIYLYNAGCVPTHGEEYMRAYQRRLALLARIKVATSPDPARSA